MIKRFSMSCIPHHKLHKKHPAQNQNHVHQFLYEISAQLLPTYEQEFSVQSPMLWRQDQRHPSQSNLQLCNGKTPLRKWKSNKKFTNIQCRQDKTCAYWNRHKRPVVSAFGVKFITHSIVRTLYVKNAFSPWSSFGLWRSILSVCVTKFEALSLLLWLMPFVVRVFLQFLTKNRAIRLRKIFSQHLHAISKHLYSHVICFCFSIVH